MRRALPCVAALAVFASSSIASAQVRSFPYEAVVQTEGVPVHSGPGYYVTNRLAKGHRVTVHRHDPGGWYMISPPAGEFSLVAAQDTRTIGPDAAEVVIDETTARVGSRISGEHNIEQVPLARGERVRLAAGVNAPAGWIAIEPPRGEFRWVPGKYLVPASDEVRTQQDADPFAIPSAAKRPEAVQNDAIVAQGAKSDVRPTRPAPLAEAAPQIAAKAPESGDASDALRMLDHELEGLTLSEPTQWPLEDLAAEYRRLKDSFAVPGRQIDVRLAQIERMRIVREHYTQYVQLTSATDERDAALIARHSGFDAGRVVQVAKPAGDSPVTLAAPQPIAEAPNYGPMMRVPQAPTASSPMSPVAPATAPHIQASAAPPAAPPSEPPAMNGPLLQAPGAPPGPAVASGPMPTQSSAAPAGTPQRFDAVGVIQKSVAPHPAAPKHVLVSPNGQILVYLQSKPGISLDQFVGQPMGVDGERLRHPELTPPMIVVERLTPVRQ